jgi:hypothetical protein
MERRQIASQLKRTAMQCIVQYMFRTKNHRKYTIGNVSHENRQILQIWKWRPGPLDHIPTARFRTSVPPCPFCKRPLKLCHLLTLQSSHSNSPQFSLTYNHLVFWSVARRTTSLHLPCAAPAVGLRVGSWEGDQLIFFFRSWIWIFRLVRGIVSGGRECLFQIQFDTFLNEINFYDPFLLKFLIVYVGSRFNLIQIQIVGFLLMWWILRSKLLLNYVRLFYRLGQAKENMNFI